MARELWGFKLNSDGITRSGLLPSPSLFLSCVWAAVTVSFSAGPVCAHPRDYLKQSNEWFAGEDARTIAANILSYQSEIGGWPKNVNTTGSPYTGDRKDLKPIFDNGATTDELRFLARVFNATNNAQYRTAFEKGLDYILKAQYPHGGWPQTYPPGPGYNRHITFNDDAMVRLMNFVREVGTGKGYEFLDEARRTNSLAAFDRGIGCILRCQIQVGDRLTVWCAQHDEIDFRPRPARRYELATFSGAESVGITRLLMSLKDPSPEVVTAIDAAVVWFGTAKLTGIRVMIEKDEKGPKGTNKVVVSDPNASPLWARFYDLESNQPVFCDRDGVPKRSIAEIGYERRNGYAWYGTWPAQLLDVEYPAWRARIAAR